MDDLTDRVLRSIERDVIESIDDAADREPGAFDSFTSGAGESSRGSPRIVLGVTICVIVSVVFALFWLLRNGL